MTVENDLVKNKEKYADKAVGSGGLIFSHELLSPAGDEKCLYEAINAGADAVYAGVEKFGARAYAGNFTQDSFISAIKYVHLFGKKLYLTLNTLVKEGEFHELYGLIKPLYEAGLDGIIVQDMGVVSFIGKEFPDLNIHASTQMSVNTRYGVELLKDLGVSRVVLSRELSLKEISDIRQETGMELECFIHGAMCYSYSGQCLMSSFYGGRSGNRGRCAGPCRLPYSAGDMKECYILCMKDLCTIDILDRLFDAGISSFKIEGRMKSPAYVAGVTRIYRKYMDMLLSGKRYSVDPKDRDELVALYTREGISTGYYERRNSLSMISKNKPGYSRLDKEGKTYGMKRKKISAECLVEKDKEVSLSLMSDGISITEIGVVAQQAGNRPLTEEAIIKQITKTGDSFFEIDDIRIMTDGESFVPVSTLNDLRRKALCALLEKLDNGNKRVM
ncbi:MAG: U32 family peptidase [Lachnospiraceae bacterium]|nr:U32 family peptidase [Lachnospiraceae bacterium]